MKDLRYCCAARLLLAALALLFALTSCDHGWLGDARLVNKRHDKDTSGSDGGGAGNVSDGDEATVEEGETDPFEVDADWNKIDYVFSGDKLDNGWVLYTATFDSSNIPTYGFSSGSWTLSDESTCEYKYNASGAKNKAQGFTISNMYTYQYRGKNPFFSADSSYNTGTRVSRFRFYRMTGTALVVSLDQYLIAVDTYSKFVFAYGKITDTKTVIGSIKMPKTYDAIENYGDYQFYEYDPIGYVNSDGTVTLYDQYKTDMGNASNGLEYVPLIHDGYTTMAEHSSNGEGRSPYYPGLYE